jgi:hypothetical protein
MTPQIRLQKQQLADLQCIREIGEAGLHRIIVELNKLPLAPAQPRELQTVFRAALDQNETLAQVVLRQLLSLHAMLRQLDLSPEEIFSALNFGLSESDWNKADFKKWEPVSTAFKNLFELPIVRLSAKALDLSYQHSHLLQRAQIVTDIRPLFNQDATEIQGTIISHKLLLRYDDIEGEHVLSLAVDEKDIKSLIRQCERALKKSQTATTQLNDKAGLKTLVPGKE